MRFIIIEKKKKYFTDYVTNITNIIIFNSTLRKTHLLKRHNFVLSEKLMNNK